MTQSKALDTNKPPIESSLTGNRLMYAMRQCHRIRVHRADDDSTMVFAFIMQGDKVPTIECHHGPSFGDRKRQHFVVGKTLSSPAAFVSRCNVMPQPPKLLDDGKREVLVGVDASHFHASSLAAICRSISSQCDCS